MQRALARESSLCRWNKVPVAFCDSRWYVSEGQIDTCGMVGSKLCPSKESRNRMCLQAGFTSGQEQVIVLEMVSAYSSPV